MRSERSRRKLPWLTFALNRILGRLQSVIQQHANGHWTDAAGHRGDRGCAFLSGFKFNVTSKFTVGQTIDADVDDDGSRLDPVTSNKSRFADCHDQYIRPGYFIAQAYCARMTNCHCGMLFEQHQRYWFANDIAPADDHSILAFESTARRLEKFHNPQRRAWPKAIGADNQHSLAHWMETIDIFERRHRLENSFRADVSRKRQLNQNSVNIFIFVQTVNQGKQFLFRNSRGKEVLKRFYSHFFTGFFFVLYIDM